jgi:YHS domain-containing protein
MEVDETKARAAGKSRSFQGKTYYFCSEDCLHRFDRQQAAGDHHPDR